MRHLPPPAPAARRRVLVVAAILTACAAGGAQEAESVVYYQVVTDDNRIRDTAEVPRTREGVRSVLRISRIEGAYPGHIIHTVNAAGFGLVQTGRTARTQLRWDGQAWVAPAGAAAEANAAATRPAGNAGEQDQARQQAAKLLVGEIQAAKDALAVAEKAVLAAAEMLTAAKGTDNQAPAMLLLEQAQKARGRALRELVQLEGMLAEVDAPATAPARESGQALPGEIDPDDEGMLGVARPVQTRRVLPYRSHVWLLPRDRGRREYSVSMAHPEAGYYGAFHYVAYADTTGDGQPDTLIARSPLAVAQHPGQWTQWHFTTDRPGDVFVGSAWPYVQAAPYYDGGDPAEAAGNWNGLGTVVYVSGSPHGGPFRRWDRPYTTNLRVRRRQRP